MADAYQVFNPQTGQHTRHETEAEAKAVLVEIAKQVIALHTPTVNQETVHENGDVTWTPVDFVSQLTISI
jgi:hypothetical protein